MSKHNYITTPLYYVNDLPHIGHAYTTVVADVLHKYNKLFGNESLFLTGVDEHGQKVQKAAEKRGKTPKEHCDELSQNFTHIWKELGIDFDIFYRTTDPKHHVTVKKALSILHDKGDIYEKSYEGWYAESEEIFYAEKDIKDGLSPMGNEVKKISETNYFFKMSDYQSPLIQYIEENPGFIQPETKKNEVMGFLKQPLQDLCISRPKSRLAWGIEIPFDPNYVTYVWFDALLNYAAALGALDDSRQEEFKKWWPSATHLIGKDILTTHSVYWTTMLMALELPMPKCIFAHGWWLTDDNEKMSKSKGSVVKPLDMKDIVGIDGLRYFLMRDIRLGNDAQFSQNLVISRVNTDLANNLGNLLNRSTGLVVKYFDGKLPSLLAPLSEKDEELKNAFHTLPQKIQDHIESLNPSQAMEAIMSALHMCNQYIDESAPWKQAKEDLAQAGHTLRMVIECLHISAQLLLPVMPKKMPALLARLGAQPFAKASAISAWPLLQEGQAIEKGDALFPRIDVEKK